MNHRILVKCDQASQLFSTNVQRTNKQTKTNKQQTCKQARSKKKKYAGSYKKKHSIEKNDA
jgi:hypothetical protein